MKFVRIEPGEFLMGSPDSERHFRFTPPGTTEEKIADEKPRHRVRISRAFYLSAHEVTQGQYRAVMGENPSHFQGLDDKPVEQVSWFDAVRFCNALSARERRAPCYQIEGKAVTPVGGTGYRLPTEAEWEYACRAGSSTRYPFGEDGNDGVVFDSFNFKDEKDLGKYAWFDDLTYPASDIAGDPAQEAAEREYARLKSEQQTHPVGQKQANVWGLYDMMGNVWEWCQDWYGEAYYQESPPDDPPGPPGPAPSRVLRGGSLGSKAMYCRPANRKGHAPEFRAVDLGFRVAAVQE